MDVDYLISKKVLSSGRALDNSEEKGPENKGWLSKAYMDGEILKHDTRGWKMDSFAFNIEQPR